jgi:hypothetical protein
MPSDICIALSDKESGLLRTLAPVLAGRRRTEAQAAKKVFLRGLAEERVRLSTYVWFSDFLKRLRSQGVSDAVIARALAGSMPGRIA